MISYIQGGWIRAGISSSFLHTFLLLWLICFVLHSLLTKGNKPNPKVVQHILGNSCRRMHQSNAPSLFNSEKTNFRLMITEVVRDFLRRYCIRKANSCGKIVTISIIITATTNQANQAKGFPSVYAIHCQADNKHGYYPFLPVALILL